MDFHVGSLANLIHQKTHGNTSGTKLFDRVSSDVGSGVQFKVIPAAKRKRITEPDLVDVNETKEDAVWDGARPKFKKSKQNNAVNAAKRLQNPKPKEKERVVNPDEDRRTIFIGNLPCNIKLTKLKKIFKPYGEIESARLRCPPIKDPKLPKRVAAIKKEFHPDRTNIVGYVRFSCEEEAMEAVKANGLVYKDHHLRVDLSTKSRTHDQKKAIFVGNVHFGTEENDMWKVFENCGPIDSVRIIRDSVTGVGKGFAYVNFKDLSSVELALKLDGTELKEREIRVTRAVKKVKLRKGDPRLKRKSQGMRKRDSGQGWKGERKAFVRGGGPKEEKGKEWGGRPDVKLKIKSNKGKPSVKNNSEESSFLGNRMDDKVVGKIKKKKLSKSGLKKRVLAFQLQLKESGISNP